jgi:hypothetical protein
MTNNVFTAERPVSSKCLLASGPGPQYLVVTIGYYLEFALKHRLAIIVGSTRPGRVGPIFAEWFEAVAREHGKFEPVMADLAKFDLPLLDEPHHPRLGKYERRTPRPGRRRSMPPTPSSS